MMGVGGSIGVHFDLGTHYPLSLGDRDIQLVALRLLPLSLLSVSLMFGSGLLLGCLIASAMYFRIVKERKFLL